MPYLKRSFKSPHYILIIALIFTASLSAQSGWYEKSSEHFKLIYRDTHQHLTDHILNSAENAYQVLKKIFNSEPETPIIINTYDISDYGFGATTTVPQNFIRLEIEPFEPGYENTPYNERFQWVMNHELVHIFVNDAASRIEKVQRSIFGKVAPVQIQPLSIIYSLGGNFNRYTPRWYQEALAVYLETWLSGGFGRILGNFDEMYFRSMVADSVRFPSDIELETISSHDSFLLEQLFYLYGGRFAAYLSLQYGSEKLFNWFRTEPGDVYPGYRAKFKRAFNIEFDKAWNDFIEFEKKFQLANISRLEAYPLTRLSYLSDESLGWITEPYIIPGSSKIIFGCHRPHNLAGIKTLDIETGKLEDKISVPSPSMFQVASTAYDSSLGLFFYTTNNNQLYRDLWAVDSSGETKLLFPDARIGQITAVAETHEIWGVQHWGGMASLVYSVYPYVKVYHIKDFEIGEEVLSLAADPKGEKLAAVIHRSSGKQELIIIDVGKLKKDRQFSYFLLSDKGEPDNPSWSPGSESILWNAALNGVSNIYSCSFKDSVVRPLTNTIKGLFKPVYINKDSIFAFEFSESGFYPVKFKIEPAEYLPAIKYLGERIAEKEKTLADLEIKGEQPSALYPANDNDEYNALTSLNINTIIPVVTGFQKQAALGFFVQAADPLLNHDISTEIAYSPFSDSRLGPRFHFKLKYEYLKKYEIGIDHNATDFYDLFNERKRGMIGTKVRLGYIYYWLYDNPHKIVQKTEAAVYRGVKYINDNLVAVSEPDFAVAQTSLNSKNLRKTIGSSDFEYGDEYTFTFMLFGSDPHNPEWGGQIYGEWDRYMLWLFNHNVFHYKIAAGYHNKNDNLVQSMFFFGGFGNRLVENVDVKQFRSLFRFPGIPIYSLSTDRFIKLTLENNFAPIRFADLSLGDQLINHIDASVYSQMLVAGEGAENFYVDIGGQINLILKHWFNLETTLSFGAAQAWSQDYKSPEWFFSIKLLKN